MNRHFDPDLMARALLVRIDDGSDLTWDHALDKTQGFAENHTKAQLVQVLAILAASWVKRGDRP